MTNFTALYADIILKKIVTKIRKDTSMKNKATERKLANASHGRSVRTMRHWCAAASSVFYYKEMATGYERMRDLDKLTKWSEKLNQDRFKFMDKFEEVFEYYNLHYKGREAE